jgi:hypothetical protein
MRAISAHQTLAAEAAKVDAYIAAVKEGKQAKIRMTKPTSAMILGRIRISALPKKC